MLQGDERAAALLALGPANGVAAWVMKPAALGGAERTLALTDRAHANGVRAVISSSFESPLGLANLVHLAQAVDTRARARSPRVYKPGRFQSAEGRWSGEPEPETRKVENPCGTSAARPRSDLSRRQDHPDPLTVTGAGRHARAAAEAAAAGRASAGILEYTLPAETYAAGPASPTVAAAANGAAPPGRHLDETAHGLGTLGWFHHYELAAALAVRSEGNARGLSGAEGEGWASGAEMATCWLPPPATNPKAAEDAAEGERWEPPPGAWLAARDLRQLAEAPVVEAAPGGAGWVGPAAGARRNPAEARCQVDTALGRYDFRVLEMVPEVVPEGGAEGGAESELGSRWGEEKPALLFLHGFLGAAEDWVPAMAALSRAGFRCVALDLPGHGGTLAPKGAPGAHSLEAAAVAVEAAAEALGLSQGPRPLLALEDAPGILHY
eukprot:1184720-Prorocentrum_minimum.AAC.6